MDGWLTCHCRGAKGRGGGRSMAIDGGRLILGLCCARAAVAAFVVEPRKEALLARPGPVLDRHLLPMHLLHTENTSHVFRITKMMEGFPTRTCFVLILVGGQQRVPSIHPLTDLGCSSIYCLPCTSLGTISMHVGVERLGTFSLRHVMYLTLPRFEVM
ncbi:hypothetical protein BJ166DRAFT_98179 [Pestalotiopsis sp. NC0098]|nr:hypothetical protein BJ166DRAFT_98179 [Pestalotiopsis sp. NC0098]